MLSPSLCFIYPWVTLALILDPALTLLPPDSPGRAKVLLAGKEGPQNTYFIVCTVIQKYQFICRHFIAVTQYWMFLWKLLEE